MNKQEKQTSDINHMIMDLALRGKQDCFTELAIDIYWTNVGEFTFVYIRDLDTTRSSYRIFRCTETYLTESKMAFPDYCDLECPCVYDCTERCGVTEMKHFDEGVDCEDMLFKANQINFTLGR